MESVETTNFNDLVKRYLGAGLPDRLADQVNFPELTTEAREVILRLLALMRRASCPATEFNAQMIWLLAAVTPGMLPSAWGGRIPPVTFRGRHRKLDEYVLRHAWPAGGEQPVYMDLGCGFPPVTTIDTAGSLPAWLVFGVDRSFARYVLYDEEGRYACFNGDGEFQYFQSPARPLDETPELVRAKFKSLFADLFPRLKSPREDDMQAVEEEGRKLVSNPLREFESRNLNFIAADIREISLQPARFIRCMNVLLYFEKETRQRMLASIGGLLDDDGRLMVGFNHPFGIYSRYAVYAKDADRIYPVEFAFSPDNLRPLGIGPWLTLADEDREAELLADLTGVLRSDRRFWPDFSSYVDGMREKVGLCRRGRDGFICFTEEIRTGPPQAMMEKTTLIWNQVEKAGYTDGAVEALKRAGHDAWKNAVNDIAVRPPDGSLQAV